MRTIVLDTNVLLSDPDIIFGLPETDLVIPETVLGELDKIKTSRADADLRFRGRKVSRHLFDLSEEGPLTQGVTLPGGGSLRVVNLDPDFEMPEGLSGRNADDRILAVAFQVRKDGCEDLTLATNDLNMLLKAQMLGVSVMRHDDGPESSFARRFIVRPFQRYKIPLAILAMSLAVFAAIVVLTLLGRDPGGSTATAVPEELRFVLSEQQETILDLLIRLEQNPTDLDALLNLGNEYFNIAEHSGSQPLANLARNYYEQYLQANPGDHNVRTDLATMYYLMGDTDRAIQEVSSVLRSDPDHINANHNLGIFYWRGRSDPGRAAPQFERVLELTEGSPDPVMQNIYQTALTALAAMQEEASQPATDADDGGT